jgi:hypothetical protein
MSEIFLAEPALEAAAGPETCFNGNGAGGTEGD